MGSAMMTAPHSTPTCMTLTLPRRFLPFLFALAVSIALALSARQLLRENSHSFGAAFTALFAIVLALVALWRALRQARYVLHPESLHLDRHGLHIRHHAVAGRTLHLRPADILELKHNGATLSLDWRDNETTRHAILRLHRACYSDVSGKTRRGEAAVALLVARLGQQRPAPPPARRSRFTINGNLRGMTATATTSATSSSSSLFRCWRSAPGSLCSSTLPCSGRASPAAC